MSLLLCVALVAVYVLGVAGVVAAGTIVESSPEDPRDLDDRLAVIRETTAPGTIIPPRPRHARRPGRAGRTARRPRNTHRRANASRSLHGAVESIARAFTPVVTQRMRSDVATSGSLRSAHSH